MTTMVTITRAGRVDEVGNALAVGSSYSLSDSLAASLVGSGFATATVRPSPNEPTFSGLVYTGVWAGRPLASTVAPGSFAYISDIGPTGRAAFVSDGTTWRPVNGSLLLAQSAVPVILLSSATNISATGLVTGLTVLPYTPSGVVQVYCFAQTGLTAGLYYARFSSTTSCQLYSDAAGTVALSGITAAAYAGGTTEVTLASLTVSGGAMGANGLVKVTQVWQSISNVNVKTIVNAIAGTKFLNIAVTSSQSVRGTSFLRNVGSQAAQKFGNQSTTFAYQDGASTSGMQFGTVDTSATQNLTLTGALAVATDYIILEGYTVELLAA